MEARFINGSSVNRVHGDGKATELVAAFQFKSDAIEFAKAKLAADAERDWRDSSYVVSETLSGEITIIRHEPSPRPNGETE